MNKMINSCTAILDRAAEKFGQKTAFCDKDGEISFSDLKSRALKIGTYLLDNTGASKTRPVLVCMEKSINSVVSFMGAMYAGAPYVPVDCNIPRTRLEKTIENLKPAAVITDTASRFDGFDIDAVEFDTASEYCADEEKISRALMSVCDLDPAYIMYTSGSTGVPKGVTISHRAVIDYTLWLNDTFDIDETSVIGMQSAFHFDNSVFDMFITLYTGAKNYIIPEILFMYPQKLIDYMNENQINTIFWVPTVMISMANSSVLSGDNTLPPLRLILFAGEVMPNTQLNIWRKAFPDAVYVNMYGPTEVCDIATYYIVECEFENHETLPIGKPCANMKAIILNDKDELCGIGEQGELCIGGSALALGYWNAPELTNKAFVQNPLNKYYHEKIYRTGDLVYKNDEGNIIFIGRADTQIKLRGNRIELGDLESAASAIDGVNSSCALFDCEKQEIVLFLESDEEIVQRKFKLALRQYVPAYMIPSKIVTMSAFPHTPSGKIDRVLLKNNYL
ncbi:MAG: amino acid adenylation domain-containing protein [Clostridiales bacterium]|nr:amino acid adenylation domain-containing protein [Clostridiales bacterium]